MTLSIYEMLTQRVHAGEPFSIDFEKRNIKLNGKHLVKNGEWDGDRLLLPSSLQNCDVMKTIEELYFEYKHSLPSERNDKKRKRYFKALSVDDIPDAILFTAERREVAQARLEGFVLCSVLNGSLKWEDEKKWFYQSVNDPDLVVLRSWVENK